MSRDSFTVDPCPNCGAHESGVAHPATEQWHCFVCHANGTFSIEQWHCFVCHASGTFRIEYTVTTGSDPNTLTD